MRKFLIVSFLASAMFAGTMGCDDDKKITHVYGDTYIAENTYDNDTVTYVIHCKNGHKHAFVDHCPKGDK